MQLSIASGCSIAITKVGVAILHTTSVQVGNTKFIIVLFDFPMELEPRQPDVVLEIYY